MTYVTDQTSAELRAHMRRLQKMPGWHNPLDDRLFAEVLALDAEIEALRAAQPAAPAYTTCGGCGATEPRQRCIGCLHNFEEQPHDR